MHLDTPTLLAAITVAYYTGALVLGIMAFALKSLPKTVRLSWAGWSVAMLLSGTCASLVSLRGTVPDFVSIGVANALMIIGFGIRPNALSLLNAGRLSYLWLLIAGLFGWLALYQVPWFRDDLILRVLYINAFSVLAMSLCIRECWLQHKVQFISSWFLIGVFAVDILLRLNLILMNFNTHFANFKAAFQTPSLQFSMVVLLVAIVFKIVGLGIAVFEKMKGQYKEQALVDALTGLPNRRAFESSAQGKLDALRAGAGTYALMTLEIDGLQSINDRFGHSMGEALMRLLGRICQETPPGRAEVGLIRENQFGLFVPETDQTEAGAIAKRISRTLTVQSTRAAGKRLTVTVSCGIFCGDMSTPFDRALEVADHCLSKARAKGGNRIVVNGTLEPGPLHPETVLSPFATRQQATG
ncbi:GGDEF domain-containing protein [Roseibium aggregatum]|uniref:diguanylate cyclase n=1 Tax=Roseibium aggregatum TaxID=187304 RepID=A0A926S5C7_9HYPH|nr:GGDEF domain-containing protein [Roseibium aggregatum]MBD1545302.1 diguanylate cyclase [Roseibium aggregatum]